MVDSLDFFVDVESPNGLVVVPLELDRSESVITPLELVVRSLLLLETLEFDGAGMMGLVVDSVVEELEDELCARAAPVIRETAIAAVSKVLII